MCYKCNQPRQKISPFFLCLIIAAVLVVLGAVGQQDYQDARCDECWSQSEQHYDVKTDKCYKEPYDGKAV